MRAAILAVCLMLLSSQSITELTHVESKTLQPNGWVEFCNEAPEECVSDGNPVTAVVLTPELLRQLREVNELVNEFIEPVTDQQLYGRIEYWTYPPGKGDCEDYALLKRKMLLERGWPTSVLLMTVVLDLEGSGHAVLMVVTDRGPYVLDNKHTEVLYWSQTGYDFRKWQSRSDPNVWVGTTSTTSATP